MTAPDDVWQGEGVAQVFPQIEASIAEEQAFFDVVRAAREDTRELQASAWEAAGNPKDRARLKANADADTTLGPPDEAVAFLRIDTEDGGCLYVGEHGVADATHDRLVYSWRAPAILNLRGATHEDTRGVRRHRRYETRPVNEIGQLDDLVLAALAEQVKELGRTGPEILASDEFLQTVLRRGRTPEMQTIVQTIQAAQSDVIAAPADQLLVIQGGPGTGKTAVALHRVAALLFGPLQDKADGRVLVVGPNPTFLRYISRVLPELGEENVVQQDIGRLMTGSVSVSVSERPEAARLKGDDRMVELLARGLSDRVRTPADPFDFGLEDISWRVSLSAEDVADLLSEVDVLPYAPGRARFRTVLEQKILTEAHRRQRSDRWTRSDNRLRLRPGEVEAAVERIWPQLSPAAFLRELFGSAERLLAAGGSTLNAEEVRLLRRQAAPRIGDQLWSKEDLPLLDQVSWEMSGEAPSVYAHIVVDEAQDLSPMQLIALRRRSATGAMTIVGDIAQSTGHWARDSWDDLVAELASPLPSQTVQLDYGYRVPRRVMELAARLLPVAAPGVLPPRVVRDVDRGPRCHEFGPEEDRFEQAVRVVREHSSNGLFVGVICPDSSREPLEKAFAEAGIQWNNADNGGLASAINVVSPGAAKGLEFDAAVVVDPQTIIDAGPQGERMLYVALTRTTGYLDLIAEAGRVPNLLQLDHVPSPRNSSAPTSASPAPPGPAVNVSTRRGGDHHGQPARPSARERSVAFHADAVLDLLSEVAPEHLWQEILDEVRSRAQFDGANGDGSQS